MNCIEYFHVFDSGVTWTALSWETSVLSLRMVSLRPCRWWAEASASRRLSVSWQSWATVSTRLAMEATGGTLTLYQQGPEARG